MDSGPKPFKSVNAWFDHLDFLSFVEEKWKGYMVEGWAGFVVKEKLKLLKSDVKEWNSKIFGNLDGSIAARKDEIFRLDMIDDTLGLEEDDVISRNKEKALLLQETKMMNDTLMQKAKLKWLKAGDVNSAVSHRFTNRRRGRNEINGLVIDNVWTQEVKKVKERIHLDFENHFKSAEKRSFIFPPDLLERKISMEEMRCSRRLSPKKKSRGPFGRAAT